MNGEESAKQPGGEGQGAPQSGTANNGAGNNSGVKQDAAPASKAPEIDVEAIVNKKLESIGKDTEKRVRTQIAKAISGESGEKDELHPVQQALIDDPEGLINSITQQAVKAVRTDSALKEQIDAALAPNFKEFPILKNLKAEIFSEFQMTDGNLSIEERINKATGNVAKRLDLKKESDKRKDSEVEDAIMAPSGGYTTTRPELKDAAKKLTKTATDYISKRKESFSKIRNPSTT